MAISRTESITINGSQYFLGGVVYNLSYARGFNGQPSSIEASIIAESKNYQEPDLSYTSSYHISLGGIYEFDFYAEKFCREKNAKLDKMTRDIAIAVQNLLNRRAAT